MADCCAGFSSTETTAERGPNPLFRALDDCGDKAIYTAPAATQFREMMPVKFVPGTPGRITPALDGADAIGFSNEDKLTVGAGELISITRTAGAIKWKDVAAAVGASPTSQAAWWPFHIALAKANIYVEFN